jgi:hypothetical protein
MAGGRPTIYNEEILKNTRKYISNCEDLDEDKDNGIKAKVNLPTIEGLAYELKINKDTINEWRKDEDKKEFSVLIDELLAKQARQLVNCGLAGTYNSTIAKVLLTKHGYREGIENTGEGGSQLFPDKESKERTDEIISSFLNGTNIKNTQGK